MDENDDDVKSLCADSHAAFTTSVEKLDDVCRELRRFEKQVSETQQAIDAKIYRRQAALKKEVAARTAAKASRQAAEKMLT